MIRLAGICLLALCVASVSQAQIFEDNFDDGNAASRWSDPIWAQEDPGIATDGSVDYAFDYSAIAGPAPRSQGTTIGIAMETNTTDQCPADPMCEDSDEGEGVGVIPLAGLADIPAGDFLIKSDVYIFWNGLSGSTEYMSIGAFSGGAAVPLRFGLDDGDGLAWQFDGDGDSGTDILRYEDPGAGETGLGGWEDIPFGSIPGFNTGVPGQDFPGNQFAGPANRWVDVEIESVAGMVSLKVNGYTIDTFDNTGGNFSAGTLMIGQSDPFNSVNVDNADGLSNLVIFDNVCLTTPGEACSVPEPASALLLLIGAIALRGLRR